MIGKFNEEGWKVEGDATLDKWFQQIHSGDSDEVKGVMNKLFMGSGSTVLSSYWSKVGKRIGELNPPDATR